MKNLLDVVLLCRLTELSLKGYANSKNLWKNIDDIGQVFTCNRCLSQVRMKPQNQ